MPHRGNMQLRLIRVKPSMRTWVTTWSILVLQRKLVPDDLELVGLEQRALLDDDLLLEIEDGRDPQPVHQFLWVSSRRGRAGAGERRGRPGAKENRREGRRCGKK